MSDVEGRSSNVIRGPWRARPVRDPFRASKLRGLVESNLRWLRAHREQHWAQPILDNLNRNVLAQAWTEALAEQRRESTSPVSVAWPVKESPSC